MSMLVALPTIPEYYAGRSIFVTGATGFMGKVLIEKLLRSCPDIDKVYVLMRPKKGKAIEERLQTVTDLPLFDLLKEEQPDTIKNKIIPLAGDVKELELGLSEEDKETLIENVSIIFHAAASVRFDDPIKDAILMNTRGTREVASLALKMKKLDVFLHISTTYCNTDRKQIDEQLYPPHGDWRKSIELAERLDEHTLNILTSKYMGKLPNTYTFTKSLAEHVVYDMCQNKIPAIIFRPSIVISTMKEPMPGWIDNFNGPVAMLAVCGKGILRSIYSDPDVVADYMPVDIAIKGLMISVWKKGTARNLEEKSEVSFYNCSSYNVRSITMGQMVDMARQLNWEIPLTRTLWYPGGSVTTSKYLHYLKVILQHLIPAIFVDLIFRATGKKPMLVKIQRKMFIANHAIYYFISSQWDFLNDNFLDLDKKVLSHDAESFRFDVDNVNVYGYFRNAMFGGRKYLLHEDESTVEQARTNMIRMYTLHLIIKFLFYGLLFYFLFYKMKIFSIFVNKYNEFYEEVFGE